MKEILEKENPLVLVARQSPAHFWFYSQLSSTSRAFPHRVKVFTIHRMNVKKLYYHLTTRSEEGGGTKAEGSVCECVLQKPQDHLKLVIVPAKTIFFCVSFIFLHCGFSGTHKIVSNLKPILPII